MITGTLDYTRPLGNGSATAFSFANKVFAASDMAITLIDTSGNQYAFTYSSNLFTNIALGLTATVSNVDVDAGCIVTFSGPVTVGWIVDLRTNIPETQNTSIKNQGTFLPELHEEAFDRLTRELQDLRRLAYTFGIHGPDTEGTPWTSIASPSARVNSALTFDSSGQPVAVPITSLVGVGVAGTATADVFTTTLNQTVFALSTTVGSINNLTVSLDGAVLVPGDDYTWSASILTLIAPALLSQRLLVRYFSSVGVATVAAGAVGDTQLTAGSNVAKASKLGVVEVTVASAATVDLGAQTSSTVLVTGVTGVTSFGSSAPVSGVLYLVRFSGSLLLTNSSNLILPGGLNITTLAGDSLTAKYEGTNVWRVTEYNRAIDVPTSSSGDTIRRGIAVCKIKSALTAKTTTTALANDPDLAYAIPVAGTYAIDVLVPVSGGAGGVAFNLNFSGAITTSIALIELIANSTPVADKSLAISAAVATVLQSAAAVTTLDVIRIQATLVAGGAGTVAVAWAQNSSNAAATNFGQGAYMNVTLLS